MLNEKTFYVWNNIIKHTGGGVYEIRNKLNGDCYIGSTVNFYARCHTHKSKLIKGVHPSSLIQEAINLFGINNFEFNILEKVEDKNELRNVEQKWIDKISPKLNFYKSAFSPEGHVARKETKEKMSKSQTGHKRNVGQVAWNKGMKGVQVPWNKGINLKEYYEKRIGSSLRGE